MYNRFSWLSWKHWSMTFIFFSKMKLKLLQVNYILSSFIGSRDSCQGQKLDLQKVSKPFKVIEHPGQIIQSIHFGTTMVLHSTQCHSLDKKIPRAKALLDPNNSPIGTEKHSIQQHWIDKGSCGEPEKVNPQYWELLKGTRAITRGPVFLAKME